MTNQGDVMETAVKLPEQVQWSEGLLLSPQHLQQHDMYWQQQLCYQAATLNPDYWGVRLLEIDDAQLPDGKLMVTRLECVLPDGTVIQYPQAFPDLSLSLDAKAALDKSSGPLLVSLVLPVRGTAVSTAAGIVKRYASVDGGLVADENTGAEEVAIARLRPLIALQAGAVASNYCGCPLLQVERDTTGRYRLTRFHPPMLDLHASSCYAASGVSSEYALLPRILRLRTLLWAKLRELSGAPVEGGDSAGAHTDSVAGGPEDRYQLMVARQLAMMLPAFDVQVLADRVAPREMYGALALLAGLVSAIDVVPAPPSLAAYRHDDCYAQFDTVLRYIDDKLTPITSNFELLSFDQLDETRFSRMMPDDIGRELIVEIKPRPGQSPEEIDRWLSQSMVCSADLARELGLRRLLGALTAALDVAEVQRLGLRTGALYYRIKNQKIDYEGQPIKVFRARQPLLIGGPASLHAPAGIILYRERGAVAAETPSGDGHARV
jgi:type VI secretion system protein ImpJ